MLNQNVLNVSILIWITNNEERRKTRLIRPYRNEKYFLDG